MANGLSLAGLGEIYSPSESYRDVFLTQLRPYGVTSEQAGRVPSSVAAALNNVFGHRASSGWGTTSATRGKIWVRFSTATATTPENARLTSSQIAERLRRSIRSVETQLGGSVRLLLPGERVPSGARSAPAPASPPPPASSGAPAESAPAPASRRRRSRPASAASAASAEESEFLAEGGEAAGDKLPDWVLPVAIVGGVTLVGAIGLIIWGATSTPKVSANRRRKRSSRRLRRLAANTHRSIRLEWTVGDSWVVTSSNSDVHQVLGSLVGPGQHVIYERQSGHYEDAMQWKLDRRSRDMVWNALRDRLKSERGSRGGLVHWADQRVYDFFSAEHE